MSGNAEEPVLRRTLRAHTRVSGPTLADDFWNIDQRLHVIDDRGLAEEAGLGRKGRLVARFAAIALNGIKQCCLFATDVSAGTAPQIDIKAESRAQNILAQEPVLAGGLNGLRKPL